ncbi:hypothetical protein DS901_05260 [Loktanella sp. D2R18]|uniref:Hint domain-containing protein n=1 Tax=Rhodobacterales TaxID=204455 RepID=UPI000DEBD222|nr:MULTISPECIES: Hint domain-containing protein [Rhodobacterales]MDO6590730.1 Hint domain-containing protein [Yoonia sp. 1_MG-2023]RBW44651.1 hypothetical protein DS901_05260 [Loktanella sp. D2R18]
MLGDFGAPTSQTLEDADGVITPGETADLDTTVMNVIATGTAQAGIALGPATIGVGPQVPVILMQDPNDDQMYMVFPDGEPSAIGGIAMIFNLDDSPSATTPICFVYDTPLLTISGYKKIQDIRAGEYLVDWAGSATKVLWIGAQRITNLTDPTNANARPLSFAPTAFGRKADQPAIRFSGNHRILISDPMASLYFGSSNVLVPAKAMCDGQQAIVEDFANTVTYYHVLCERHTLVCAGGIWAETLALGPVSNQILGPRKINQINTATQHCTATDQDNLRQTCLPTLKPREVSVLIQNTWQQLSPHNALAV